MGKDKKLVLKPVFKSVNLLTANSFISYCKENRASIDVKELEKLHKQGLLFPAVQLLRGVIIFKKILIDIKGERKWRFINPEDIKKFKAFKTDSKKYYSSGGFNMSGNNWLDYYIKNKMIFYPADEKYKVWDKKIYLESFITDYGKLKNQSEFFYDKSQLLALKIILREKRYWRLYNKKQMSDNLQFLKNKLADFYRFMEIYYDIEEKRNNWLEIKIKRVEEYQKQGLNKNQMQKTWQDDLDFDLKKILKKTANDILSKYHITSEYIENWKIFLIKNNVFGESISSSKILRAYIKGIDERSLINAEDTNYMIHVMNFFNFCFNNEDKTVKQVLENTNLVRCSICKKAFSIKKLGQITCGDPECIRENKNRGKRLKRKTVR